VARNGVGAVIVQRNVVNVGTLTLCSGATLQDVRLGYETYGRLNGARDNTILICHPFPSNAHAAGRYSADDALPGFWDALIGPDKAINTDCHFVICIDGLCNLGSLDGMTVAPGPKGDPAFPEIAIRDLVESQRQLLATLGITRLRAVAGPSMGAMQALEWGAAYPDAMDAIIAALPVAVVDPYTALMIQRWIRPLESALALSGDKVSLQRALVDAFAILSVDAQGRTNLAKHFTGRNDDLIALLQSEAKQRAAKCDPIAFVRLTTALQRFSIGYGFSPRESFDRLKAPVLLAPAQTDELFPPTIAEGITAELKTRGKSVELFEIPGDAGHRDGVGPSAERMTAAVRRFLELAR
jgi:homoserine O-acetyltransferase/O-succinyltransferase